MKAVNGNIILELIFTHEDCETIRKKDLYQSFDLENPYLIFLLQ